MTYNEVIKELESIGLEIDYASIDVEDLNAECEDVEAFKAKIKESHTV